MTGTRGKKLETSGSGNELLDEHDDKEPFQQASKRDVKRTQQLVQTLEDKIQGLNGTLTNITQKLQLTDTKFSQHDLRLAYLEAKSKSLQDENKKLRDRVDQLENEKRATNLKIDG